MRKAGLFAVVLMAVAMAAAQTQPAAPVSAPVSMPVSMPGQSASQSWLDGPLRDWNAQTDAVPLPPNSATINARDESIWQFCGQQVRHSGSPEDEEVLEKGWHLYGEVHVYGKLSVISAMSNADGMCRPLGYQFFLFYGKHFVGTIAPEPMDSRSDGAVDRVILTSEKALIAEFRRYTPDDPLCCPSATSTVSYELAGEGEHLHLVAKDVTTTSIQQGK
jgi:hypothetical protein